MRYLDRLLISAIILTSFVATISFSLGESYAVKTISDDATGNDCEAIGT